MTVREQLLARREEVLRIAESYGASHVRFFGSTVHNTGGPDSDIDLLVRLAPERSLLDHVALKQELQELLGRSVDVVVEGGISPYLEERILSEAVPL